MATDVSWIINGTVNDGKLDDLKAMVATMATQVEEAEPGCLNYEFYLSEDGTQFSVYERYVDSDATLTHMQNVGPHLEAFMACFTMQMPWLLYGYPDERVVGAFAKMGVTVVKRFAGFSR